MQNGARKLGASSAGGCQERGAEADQKDDDGGGGSAEHAAARATDSPASSEAAARDAGAVNGESAGAAAAFDRNAILKRAGGKRGSKKALAKPAPPAKGKQETGKKVRGPWSAHATFIQPLSAVL